MEAPRFQLKAEIALAGKRQVEVARAIGISEARFSNIVTGRLAGSPATRLRIAEVLAVPVERIFPEGRGVA